jgi:protein-tyrosine phosphatase
MSDIPDAVLFSCTYNAVRSPMAEGIMKYLHGHRVYVDSVGTRKGDLDPFMVEVMDEIGIDLSRHNPKSFEQLEDSSYDLIITLSPDAHHHALEMTRTMAADVEFWNTMDPSYITGSRDRRIDAYRQIRDQLLARIKDRFRVTRAVDI